MQGGKSSWFRRFSVVTPILAVIGLLILWGASAQPSAERERTNDDFGDSIESQSGGQRNYSDEDLATAVFAGGCFWCMEPPYDALHGVVETISGFAGGHVPNPSYNEVVAGDTGHLEVVQVRFDPSVVSYERLLEVFWINIDPLDGGGQFCDRGEHYSSAVFYIDEEQRAAAEHSKQLLDASGHFGGAEIMTAIRPLNAFYPAEEYHQGYYLKNPIRYRFYRNACGRDRRLEQLWQDTTFEIQARDYQESALLVERRVAAIPMNGGRYVRSTIASTSLVSESQRTNEPVSAVYDSVSANYDPAYRIIHRSIDGVRLPVRLSDAEWRSRLSPEQYYILRDHGTEPAFSGSLNGNTRRGVYYSAATGQPLFHSDDRYDFGSGWPSFTKPITPGAVAYAWDTSFFMQRIEVVDSLSGSHLGHVFNDGPEPTGQRYCINSDALIFVPDGEAPPSLLLAVW